MKTSLAARTSCCCPDFWGFRGKSARERADQLLETFDLSGFLHVAVADPVRLDEAAMLLELRLGASVQRSAEGGSLAVVARTPKDANAALGALIAPIGLTVVLAPLTVWLYRRQ